MCNSRCECFLKSLPGGLLNENVSAILSDITTPANRAKALAHVGIAFAICFCIGPPIGAYFASRPLPTSFFLSKIELNVYATPAVLTLVLLLLETLFLVVALPETRGKRASQHSGNGQTPKKGSSKVSNMPPAPKFTVKERIRMLAVLRRTHFLFLGIFSGIEFTLTFLTFDCKQAFSTTLHLR